MRRSRPFGGSPFRAVEQTPASPLLTSRRYIDLLRVRSAVGPRRGGPAPAAG